MPDLTAGELQQAGTTESRAWIGDADQKLGALANAAGADGERMGRCIGEQIGIHDAEHEYALLLAYKRRDSGALVAIGKAVGTCGELKVTHAASYEQSLTTEP